MTSTCYFIIIAFLLIIVDTTRSRYVRYIIHKFRLRNTREMVIIVIIPFTIFVYCIVIYLLNANTYDIFI